MKIRTSIALVPVIGYVGLWILGTALFLLYFHLFHVAMRSDYVAMIRKVPTILAIATVPACSFASFYLSARILLKTATIRPSTTERIGVAIVSLGFTVAMDLLTAVLIQRMNILVFPINLMYLSAWAVVIPAILLGARRVPLIPHAATDRSTSPGG